MHHLQMADIPLSPRPGLSEEEFFLGLGPWPNIYIGLGFPVYHPYTINNVLNENIIIFYFVIIILSL